MIAPITSKPFLLSESQLTHKTNIYHHQNVLLSAADGRLLLADFGWCTSLKRLRQTICGTHGAYLAPEMLRHEPYGPAVDLWTAGVIAHELLTGRTPAAASDSKRQEQGQGLHSLTEGLSAEARDFLARVLVEDQHARPSLKAALQHPWLDPARIAPPAALPSRLLASSVATAAASSSSSAKAAGATSGADGALPVPARRLVVPSAEEQQQQRQQEQGQVQVQGQPKRAWCITDFEIGRPIGRGRYGSVYMARCKRSQRIVALKVHFASFERGGSIYLF